MAAATGAIAWLKESLSALDRRLFVEREILLRSDGRVRYLKVPSRAQRLVAGSIVVVAGWLLYSTLTYFLQPYLIRAKDVELARQRLAYVDLLSEIGTYQSEFTRLAHNLRESQDYLVTLLDDEAGQDRDPMGQEAARSQEGVVRALVAGDSLRAQLEDFESQLREGALEQQAEELKEQLARNEIERQSLADAQQTLMGEIDTMASTLATAQQREAEAEALVGTLQASLVMLQAERDRFAGERDLLSGELAELRQDLSSALRREDSLVDKLTTLETELAEESGKNARLQGERDQLAASLEVVERDLASAGWRETALGSKVADLEEALAAAVAEREETTRDRDYLSHQVAGLESVIADMRQRQKELVERMETRTVATIGDLEALVASTGLDVEAVLNKAQGLAGGQGGPFIPADELLATDAAYELQISVAMLDLRLDRWDTLKQVVLALPLNPPLPNAQVSSNFGYRRDPINGRMALHSGVDFKAPSNTPLYTTAPGMVTFAGWRGRYGRVVEVDHGYGIKTRYAHLAKISVKKGEAVEPGVEVGLVGSSGRATGPHCHYEILFDGKPYDPMNFIKAGKDVL